MCFRSSNPQIFFLRLRCVVDPHILLRDLSSRWSLESTVTCSLASVSQDSCKRCKSKYKIWFFQGYPESSWSKFYSLLRFQIPVMDKSNSSFEPRKERIRDCDKRAVKFAISWYCSFQWRKYKMWIDFVTNVRWMCCPKQSHSRNKYPDACLSHVAFFLKRMAKNSYPWTKKFSGRVPIARMAQQRSQQHYQLMFKWSSAVLRFCSSIGIRIKA
jgi:hypothetical protein